MGYCHFAGYNHLFYSIRWLSITLSIVTLFYNYRAIDKRVDEPTENLILL